MSRSNKVIVPQCKSVLNQMKYEIAAEFGLTSGGFAVGAADTEFAGELGAHSASSVGSVHWSTLSTRQAGSVGGEITKRLVAQAEQVLNADFTL
ncbi:spore protein [Paenibacillus agaridevorans]|uniref:Spore protein n=1 Tax=Paenibacillus agaridevorans TaxID=171404 RepID=A0A2R5EPI9_9BACL|nr:alpha/beta-type small acid-soluble spore protein [Paenibacillus agaridevorans]GBG08015.1 spore protein [Paenibacillus agaridevorans]